LFENGFGVPNYWSKPWENHGKVVDFTDLTDLGWNFDTKLDLSRFRFRLYPEMLEFDGSKPSTNLKNMSKWNLV